MVRESDVNVQLLEQNNIKALLKALEPFNDTLLKGNNKPQNVIEFYKLLNI